MHTRYVDNMCIHYVYIWFKKVGASGLQGSHAPTPVPFIITFQQQQDSASVTLPTEGRSHWVKELRSYR